MHEQLTDQAQERWWRLVEAAGAGEVLAAEDEAFLAEHKIETLEARADELLLTALRAGSRRCGKYARGVRRMP